ncbi:MAG TPA: ABC transporter [Bacteroidales bacterium]|nr:ABC transporter [Bacteroidales bacterium]
MSESLLDALIKLFAILVNIDSKADSGFAIDVLEDYLHHDFSDEQAKVFIDRFTNFGYSYRRELEEVSLERYSESPMVLAIIDSINHELEQHQKVWLVLQLLEFLADSKLTTADRLEFARRVAIQFNISDFEFSNGRDFILSESPGQIPWNQQVLLISSDRDNPIPEIKHLVNERITGQIYVLRIASTNTLLVKYFGELELFMNSRLLKPGRTYLFGSGAVIRGPRMSSVYYSKVVSVFIQTPGKPFVSIVAKDIEYKHKGSRNGIYPFSFTASSGQLVGIMGGSGVGKSTLINLLNGNLKPVSGKVYINGYDVHQSKSEIEGVIGYVPQDDLLVEELTVFQNLYYNALFCFSHLNKNEIVELIDNTLMEFDLVEARNLKVGNPLNKYISGGQRKRLNIAMEIMRQPSVLFVDEPTSGLSSLDAERIMLLLRRQTFKGKLVITNIHQPSSDIFKLFDKIIVLDHGGRPIFQGNPMDAVVYFKRMANFLKPEESECITCGNVNTDIILRIVEARVVNEYGRLTRKRKRSAREWYELYLQNIQSKIAVIEPTRETPIPPNNFKIPSKRKQMWIYFRRNLRSKFANSQFMNISILASPALAIIISFFSKFIHGTLTNPNAYIFSENDNIPGFIFMSVIAMIFLGLTISAEEIISDRKVLFREKFLNLSYFSYINSKLIVLSIFSAFQSLLFVLISTHILEIQGMFWYYWAMLFSTSFCASMIGLNLSASLNSVVAIYVMIPLIIVPQLMFSGVVISYNKLHKSLTHPEYVPVIGDITLSRWPYEALCVQQFSNNNYSKHFFFVNMDISNNSYNATLLLPKLTSLLNEAKADLTVGKQTPRTRQRLNIVQNEIEKLKHNSPILGFSYPDTQRLGINSITSEYIDVVLGKIDTLRLHFNSKYRNAVLEHDELVKKLEKELSGKTTLYELSRMHHNNALAALVTNRNDFTKIVEDDGRLVRRYEPIYAYPTAHNGRAHLYSYYKYIGSTLVPTFWFNLLVIWLMSLIFYITLLSDMFRVVNRFVERFRFRKLTARIARYLPT